MGFFQKCFPYYVLKRYFPEESTALSKKGFVFRYFCPSCSKHFNEKVIKLTDKNLKGIPLKRQCAYCGGNLAIENVFQDRRSGRK